MALKISDFLHPSQVSWGMGAGPFMPVLCFLYRNKVPPPGVKPRHVTHSSTNRARRRVTLLIRPTPLPLRHAATHTVYTQWCNITADQSICVGSIDKVCVCTVPAHSVGSQLLFGVRSGFDGMKVTEDWNGHVVMCCVQTACVEMRLAQLGRSWQWQNSSMSASAKRKMTWKTKFTVCRWNSHHHCQHNNTLGRHFVLSANFLLLLWIRTFDNNYHGFSTGQMVFLSPNCNTNNYF